MRMCMQACNCLYTTLSQLLAVYMQLESRFINIYLLIHGQQQLTTYYNYSYSCSYITICIQQQLHSYIPTATCNTKINRSKFSSNNNIYMHVAVTTCILLWLAIYCVVQGFPSSVHSCYNHPQPARAKYSVHVQYTQLLAYLNHLLINSHLCIS